MSRKAGLQTRTRGLGPNMRVKNQRCRPSTNGARPGVQVQTCRSNTNGAGPKPQMQDQESRFKHVGLEPIVLDQKTRSRDLCQKAKSRRHGPQRQTWSKLGPYFKGLPLLEICDSGTSSHKKWAEREEWQGKWNQLQQPFWRLYKTIPSKEKGGN